MSQAAGWTKSLRGKLVAIGAVVACLTIALTTANSITLSSLEELPRKMNYLALGRSYASEIILLIRDLAAEEPGVRSESRVELMKLMKLTDDRYSVLLEGSEALGISPVKNEEGRKQLTANQEFWSEQTKPLLDDLLMATTPELVDTLAAEAIGKIENLKENIQQAIEIERVALRNQVSMSRSYQYMFLAVVLSVLFVVFWILRSVIRTIEETTTTLASASSELLAGTSQQTASAQEQAAAVTETVSTVDEVLQTAEQAAQRAKAVALSAQRAAEIGTVGRQAIEESMTLMGTVQMQTELIAKSILAHAEKGQAIGEIIAAVNDVAEQTNLLALNAGIEAARAGEHGAGFAVVAREIKELANQAKKETAQVRQILTEIQKATNSAVLVTEEGSRSVNATLKAVNRAGETIKALTTTIDEASIAASQITASAQQQATGMAQIRQAMRDINEATSQTTASTRQTERAAQDLNTLGRQLKELLGA